MKPSEKLLDLASGSAQAPAVAPVKVL